MICHVVPKLKTCTASSDAGLRFICHTVWQFWPYADIQLLDAVLHSTHACFSNLSSKLPDSMWCWLLYSSCHRASQVLSYRFSVCHALQFPDPHWKLRNRKKRIVQPQLVEAVAQLIAPGGQVFLQSDVQEVHVQTSVCATNLFAGRLITGCLKHESDLGNAAVTKAKLCLVCSAPWLISRELT